MYRGESINNIVPGDISNPEGDAIEKEDTKLLEEYKDYYAKLAEIKKELATRKGQVASDFLLEQIEQGENIEKVTYRNERITGLEEAVDTALERMEQNDLLSYRKDGVMMIDVEKAQEKISAKFLYDLGPIYTSKYLGNEKVIETLKLLFKDKSAIDIKDKDDKDAEPIDVFYLPQTATEALDVNKIKEANFLLSFDDVVKRVRYDDNNYGDIDDLDYREVAIPLMIYHPQYGDGFRNEQGELMIKDDKGEFRKISVDMFVEQYGAFKGPKDNDKGLSSPKAFLQDHLSNLNKSGLLTADDFGSLGSTHKWSLGGRSERNLTKRGMTMLNKVRYTLGAQFAPSKGDYKTIQISVDKGGVIKIDEEGKKNIVAMFDLQKPEEVADTDKGHKLVGVKDTGLIDFNQSDIYDQKADESDIDYEQRIAGYNSLEEVMLNSDIIQKETGLNIVDLNYKEQQLVSRVFDGTDTEAQHKIMSFLKTYGLDGLKTFISEEHLESSGFKLVEIADKMKPLEAHRLLQSYRRIIDRAEKIKQSLESQEVKQYFDNQSLNKQISLALPEAVNRRVTEIINTAYAVVTEGEASTKFYNDKIIEIDNVADIIEALEILEKSFAQIHSLFDEERGYEFKLKSTEQKDGIFMHNFKVKNKQDKAGSYFALHIRPQATREFDSDLQYDGEARINFLSSNEEFTNSISNEARKEAITIRLDREGLVVDAEGKIIENNPLKKQGRLSLDMGSVFADSGRENNLVAKSIAIGNALKGNSSNPDFNHNRDSFYKERGESDNFAEIARALQAFIAQKYSDKA